MKKRILKLALLIGSLAAPISTFAKGESTGGASPHLNDAAAFRTLLLGNGLKKAMISYLETISIKEIQPESTRRLFEFALKNNQLQNDILTPNNYIVQKDCSGRRQLQQTIKAQPNQVFAKPQTISNHNPMGAQATIGNRGGKICFDAEVLAEAYKNLSNEDIMIRLASFAFHEHYHHLQDPLVSIEQNEKDAYEFSAYIQITAKMATMPILIWQSTTTTSHNCGNFNNVTFVLKKVRPELTPSIFIPSEIELNSVDSMSIRIFVPESLQFHPVAHVNHIFQFDNKTHLIGIIRRPNPENDAREEYSAFCTKSGFTITKKNSDHTGEEGNPKVGYTKTVENYEFSKNTLRLSYRWMVYDLDMKLLEDTSTSVLYEKK